jgi:filamentous hemagglutinin family protein
MERLFSNTAVWCAMLAASGAFANPTGGVVTGGQATIQQNGTTLQITTSTPSTTITWQNFSIGTGETTNITQPSTSSVTLNQVTSQSTSQIFGSLTSNGQVFLINPNGVVFGPSSQINVASLNITTSTVSGTFSNSGAIAVTTSSGNVSIAGATVLTNVSGGGVVLTATTTGSATTFNIGNSGGIFVTNPGTSGAPLITTTSAGSGSGTTFAASGTLAGSPAVAGGGATVGGSAPTGTVGAGQQISPVATPSSTSSSMPLTPAGAKVVLLKQEPFY